MKKFFFVQPVNTQTVAKAGYNTYNTAEEANRAAQQMAAKRMKENGGRDSDSYEVIIFEAIGVARQPIPDIKVEALSA